MHSYRRNLERYAIKDLMTYIVGLNGLVFLLYLVDQSGTLISLLRLDPAMVRQGEWWRLITFAFIPPTFSPFWLFFILYFYHQIGTTLEHQWGSFRFNLYYLCGIAGTALASFLTGAVGTPTYLNLSLFLAFARLYPDFELMLFFILPVKIKYLAWLNWFFIGYTILIQPYISWKIAAVVALINYFIFFGKDLAKQNRQRQQVYYNRRRFLEQKPIKRTMHRCEICGKTELDDPKLDFRYCALCHGDHEYCMEHLKEHTHHQAPSDPNQT